MSAKRKLYGRQERRYVTCRNEECEKDIECIYTPPLAGRTYGPPERCYEAEPGDLDAPGNCPHCGTVIEDEDIERWLCEIEEEDDDNRF